MPSPFQAAMRPDEVTKASETATNAEKKFLSADENRVVKSVDNPESSFLKQAKELPDLDRNLVLDDAAVRGVADGLKPFSDSPQGRQDLLESMEHDMSNAWGELGEETIAREFEGGFASIEQQVDMRDLSGNVRIGDVVCRDANETMEISNVVDVRENGELFSRPETIEKGESIGNEVKNGKAGYLMDELGTTDAHGIKQVEAGVKSGLDHMHVCVPEDSFINLSELNKNEIVGNVQDAGGEVRIGLPGKDVQQDTLLESIINRG